MPEPREAGVHPHAGHRQRVRDKVFSGGLESMADHELIEFLLFYAVPKRDVNPLAHALTAEFGSLDRLFAADENELTRVPGVGHGVAALVAAFGAAIRQYLDASAQPAAQDFSPDDAVAKAGEHFVHPTRQEMAALFLDSRGALLCCAVRDWDIIQDPAGIRWLVERALSCGTHGVLLVWRRYGKTRELTRAELEALSRVVTLLTSAEIRLADLILLYRDGSVSLRGTGCLVDGFRDSPLSLASEDAGRDFVMDGGPADDETP